MSGNPTANAGKTLVPKELKEARKFDRVRYEAIIHRVCRMSMAELRQFMKNQEGDVLETAIAAVWIKCISSGDIARLEAFTDRIIGPVTRRLNLSGASLGELMETAIQAEKAKLVGHSEAT